MLNALKKKICYFESNILLEFFKTHKNSICLICHRNFIDSFDYKLIDDYSMKYNIDYRNIPNYIFEKLSRSSYIYNLFSGPTIVIFFTDVDKYINFFSQEVVRKKFLPFAVLYKEFLYDYKTFENYIKKYNFNNKTKLNLIKNIINLLDNNVKFITNIKTFNK